MTEHVKNLNQGQDPDRKTDDEILREWTAKLVEAFHLEGLDVDIKAVLDLAGQAARSVLRPAAPLTTFVTGYAAGLAAGSGAAGSRAAQPDAAVSAALNTALQLCREAAETT